MCLRAARRTTLVLLASALCAGTGYTAWASSAGASVPPAKAEQKGTDHGRSHRPQIGTAVKLVRNADGTVTTVRQ